MFHDESWKPIYFGVKRSRSWITKTFPAWLFALLWVLAECVGLCGGVGVACGDWQAGACVVTAACGRRTWTHWRHPSTRKNCMVCCHHPSHWTRPTWPTVWPALVSASTFPTWPGLLLTSDLSSRIRLVQQYTPWLVERSHVTTPTEWWLVHISI